MSESSLWIAVTSLTAMTALALDAPPLPSLRPERAATAPSRNAQALFDAKAETYRNATAFIEREETLWGIDALKLNADRSVTLFDGRQTRDGKLWRLYDAHGDVVNQLTLPPPSKTPNASAFCVLSDGRRTLRYEFNSIHPDRLLFAVEESRVGTKVEAIARQRFYAVKPTNVAPEADAFFPSLPPEGPEPDPLGIYRVEAGYVWGDLSDTAMVMTTAASDPFNIEDYIEKKNATVRFEATLGEERPDDKLEIKKHQFRLSFPQTRVTVSPDGRSRSETTIFKTAKRQSASGMTVELGKLIILGPTPEGVSFTLRVTRVGSASHIAKDKAREKLPPDTGLLSKYQFKLTYARNGFSDTLTIGLKNGKGEVTSANGDKSFKCLISAYGPGTSVTVVREGNRNEPMIGFVLDEMKENLAASKINVKRHKFETAFFVEKNFCSGHCSSNTITRHSTGYLGGCVLEPGQPLKLGALPNGALSVTLTAEPLKSE